MKKLSITALAVVAVSACSGTPEKPVSANIVFESSQCASKTSAATMLQDQDELDALVKRSSQQISLANGAGKASTLKLDFGERRYILVSAGMQFSAGFHYALASEPTWIEDEILNIHIELQGPPKGSMQAQVITYPCALIEVDKGGYEAVELLGLRVNVL